MLYGALLEDKYDLWTLSVILVYSSFFFTKIYQVQSSFNTNWKAGGALYYTCECNKDKNSHKCVKFNLFSTQCSDSKHKVDGNFFSR